MQGLISECQLCLDLAAFASWRATRLLSVRVPAKCPPKGGGSHRPLGPVQLRCRYRVRSHDVERGFAREFGFCIHALSGDDYRAEIVRSVFLIQASRCFYAWGAMANPAPTSKGSKPGFRLALVADPVSRPSHSKAFSGRVCFIFSAQRAATPAT